MPISISDAVATSAGPACQNQNELRAQFIASMRGAANTVAIVATKSAEGCRGLAVTAWCSVSADPPTVLVCVNKGASAHDHIIEAERFTLNVLSTRDADIAATFSGQRGIKGDDRFDEMRWNVAGSGLPILNDAICAFDCKLASSAVFGSHTVLFGSVVASSHGKSGDPLIYCAGKFIQNSMTEVQAGSQ